MDHDAATTEIQALLASLKFSLSGESGIAASIEPTIGNVEESADNRNSRDALPDPRVLRRFQLMV
jgi:hypothetical protein